MSGVNGAMQAVGKRFPAKYFWLSEIIWHKNSKDRNIYFQNLLKQDDLKTTLAIIRTIIEKQEINNKISPSDLAHLDNAKNLVHSSLAYSLNITKNEVKDYILNILKK